MQGKNMPAINSDKSPETSLHLSPIEVSSGEAEPAVLIAKPKQLTPKPQPKPTPSQAIKSDLKVPTQPTNDTTNETRTYKPLRRHMPSDRNSITHKFSISGHEGFLTIGLYDDNRPGEIFITMNKEGSFASGLLDSFATSISLALQYGIPLKELVLKFSNVRYEPAGLTDNSKIPVAKSIVDYIFRYLAIRFLPAKDWQTIGLQITPEELAEFHKKDLQPDRPEIDTKKQTALEL